MDTSLNIPSVREGWEKDGFVILFSGSYCMSEWGCSCSVHLFGCNLTSQSRSPLPYRRQPPALPLSRRLSWRPQRLLVQWDHTTRACKVPLPPESYIVYYQHCATKSHPSNNNSRCHYHTNTLDTKTSFFRVLGVPEVGPGRPCGAIKVWCCGCHHSHSAGSFTIPLEFNPRLLLWFPSPGDGGMTWDFPTASRLKNLFLGVIREGELIRLI